MTTPWNGHPLMNADRDGWHLLRFEDQKHPEPMWWDCEIQAWRTDPYALGFSLGAPNAEAAGYTYSAGMVTPEEAAASQKDAERLNWIGNQDVVIGEFEGPDYWKSVDLVRYQRSLPADLVDIRMTLDRAMEISRKRASTAS